MLTSDNWYDTENNQTKLVIPRFINYTSIEDLIHSIEALNIFTSNLLNFNNRFSFISAICYI